MENIKIFEHKDLFNESNRDAIVDALRNKGLDLSYLHIQPVCTYTISTHDLDKVFDPARRLIDVTFRIISYDLAIAKTISFYMLEPDFKKYTDYDNEANIPFNLSFNLKILIRVAFIIYCLATDAPPNIMHKIKCTTARGISTITTGF